MSLIEQARIARRCLPDSGGALVNHSARLDGFTPALDYFREAGSPQAFIEAVLTPEGVWKDFCEAESDFYQLSPEEIDDRLKKCFNGVYALANGSLDHIFTHGFNKHDLEHINNVAKQTLKLLIQAKQPIDVQRRGVASARGHDLGNPLSRKLHSLVSPKIFRKVVQEVESDPKQWRIIRRAMQLHNEPIASALIDSWQKESSRQLSELEIIERMRKEFGPEALSVIIADKTDIGRHRISEKPQHVRAVDEDPHLEVNLLGKTDKIQLNQSGKVFTWSLLFTPGMSSEEQESDKRFCMESTQHPEGARARVSRETHDLHRLHNIPHFDRWKSLFWSLYIDRVLLTVRSAFALFPNLETFKIKVKDVEDLETVEYSFSKENIESHFDRIKLKHSLHKEKD